MPLNSEEIKIVNLDHSMERLKEVKSFISTWNNDSQMVTQKTSGSTGTPKSIEIYKKKMEASARMTGEFLDLTNCNTSLICMSINYIGGKMMIVRSLLYGLDLYVTKVTKNPLKTIDFSIDFAAMVPLQVESILKENPEKLNLIKVLIIGGAPVSDRLIKRLSDYSCRAYATFGMTETISHIALRSLDGVDNPYRAIGKTIFTTEDNCLIINSEELEIKDLKTTDIIELIDPKSFFWKGRADFVINSGGVKIHPEEVERKINKVIHSLDFIISQLPDDSLGSKVVFIGINQLDTPELKERIEEVVSKYERPKAYFFLPSLKKTASGKIDRLKTTAEIQ